MRWGQRYRATALLAAVALATAAAPLRAQDDGGLRAGLTLTPGLAYEDDSDPRFRARLGFGAELSSQTRSQSFALSLRGALEPAGRPRTLSDALRDPVLSLSYGLERRNSALTASASYRRARISTLFLDDSLGEDVLTLLPGEGRRSDLDARAALTLGREAPFGAVLDLSYGQRRYSDTSDPGLRDEDRRGAGLALRFDIDRRLRVTLAGRVQETDVSGGGTDLRRESVTLGAELAVNPTLTLGAGLGAVRITETTGPVERLREGGTWDVSMVQELPDGSLSARMGSQLTTAGRLDTLRIDRVMELPRGTLGFGGGVARQGGGDPQPQVGLVWQHNASPTARLRLSLDRALRVTDAGEAGIDSRLGLSWQQEIDPLSRLGLGLNLRQTGPVGGGSAAESQQAALTLDWRRSLTPDWALRSSYTHRWTRTSGTSDRRDNDVFLGLERSFQWRP